MSSDIVTIAQVVLIILAVLQVVTATVFFEKLQEKVVRPMLRIAELQGTPVPRWVRWWFTSRLPPLMMTAVPLVLLWYVGTPAGAEFLDEVGSRTRP